VGVYQSVLFYARAVQTVLLVLVVPLFLALGRPISLVIAVFPRLGARLEAIIRSRPARIFTFPAITTFALVGVPFVMYFTSWYSAVFHSAAVRELTFLALMAPGFAFFWTLLRVDPVPKEYSYAVSMWITGAEVIGDAFLGIAVIASQTLIGANWYHALARPWGPSLRTDQVLGGGVLWILGDLVGLPFLAAQLIQLMREDESDAARIDRAATSWAGSAAHHLRLAHIAHGLQNSFTDCFGEYLGRVRWDREKELVNGVVFHQRRPLLNDPQHFPADDFVPVEVALEIESVRARLPGHEKDPVDAVVLRTLVPVSRRAAGSMRLACSNWT
jgi:cytochrome c oxidase assembly factor CtaG